MKYRNLKMGMLAGTVIALAVATLVLSLKLTQSEAQKRLKEADICFHQPCGDKENIDCASLDEIEEDTVSGLVELKEKSGCSIVVTGGTEASLLDIIGKYNPTKESGRDFTIRNGTCIYNYITSHATCKRFVSSNRAELVACEDEHYNLYSLNVQWEITFFGKQNTFPRTLTRLMVRFNSTYIN